jgi:hypothetical protein
VEEPVVLNQIKRDPQHDTDAAVITVTHCTCRDDYLIDRIEPGNNMWSGVISVPEYRPSAIIGRELYRTHTDSLSTHLVNPEVDPGLFHTGGYTDNYLPTLLIIYNEIAAFQTNILTILDAAAFLLNVRIFFLIFPRRT